MPKAKTKPVIRLEVEVQTQGKVFHCECGCTILSAHANNQFICTSCSNIFISETGDLPVMIL